MSNWWATLPLAAACLSACGSATEPVGPGLVSTSLCGDTYTDGLEVAALSWQSDGPLSARAHPRRAWADAEALVAMRPEVVLLGPGESVREEVLPDTKVVRLDWAEDVEGVKSNLQKLAAFPGSTRDLGLAEPDNRSSQPDWTCPPQDKPETPDQVRGCGVSILYLSPAGGTAGPGTYVDEAIRLAGARNLVTTPGWHTPDPEWLVGEDPDVVLLSFRDAYPSVNTPTVRNRAVAAWVAERRTVEVPGSLWPCAGPGLAEAVEMIAEGVR